MRSQLEQHRWATHKKLKVLHNSCIKVFHSSWTMSNLKWSHQSFFFFVFIMIKHSQHSKFIYYLNRPNKKLKYIILLSIKIIIIRFPKIIYIYIWINVYFVFDMISHFSNLYKSIINYKKRKIWMSLCKYCLF